MGNKKSTHLTKTTKSGSSTQTASATSTAAVTTYNFGKQSVTLLLDQDDTRRLLKKFAADKSTEIPGLAFKIDLLEQVVKREAIYKSGMRCGDDIELCKERAEESANAILDKFLKPSAEKRVELPAEDKFGKLLSEDGVDYTFVGVFEDLESWLVEEISKAIEPYRPKQP